MLKGILQELKEKLDAVIVHLHSLNEQVLALIENVNSLKETVGSYYYQYFALLLLFIWNSFCL